MSVKLIDNDLGADHLTFEGGGGGWKIQTVQDFFSSQANKTDIFFCKSAAQDIFPNIFRGRIFLPLIITAYSNLMHSYSYHQRRSRGFQSEEVGN